ncbi:MAG TPA: hypothetical protein VJU61_16855 [Polyangiaceae bacterium]|nr:hypothetical protein [Polyangiaceae bacterium]
MAKADRSRSRTKVGTSLGAPRAMEVVAGSAHSHWVRAIDADPDGVRLVSPYVTWPSLMALAARAVPPIKLYTTFRPDVFASGSSSLEALLQCVKAGHRIFHVDDLHAKLVLTNASASVGSQNLTARGQRTREVSVLFWEGRALRALRQQIQPWLVSAREIRQHEIEGLLRELPALQRAFRRYQRELGKSAARAEEAARREQSAQRQAVREERKRRRAEQARQAELDRQRQGQLQRWREQIDSSEPASYWVELQLRRRPRPTLERRSASASLTRWHMQDGSVVELGRTQRYLMVDYQTGQITWPAVFRSRLSLFGTGLISEDSLAFGDVHARPEFHTEPERIDPPGNVVFELGRVGAGSGTASRRRKYDGVALRLVARFDLDGFELLSCLPVPGSEQLWAVTEIQRQLQQNRQECEDRLRKLLLKPFKYKHNRIGRKAHQMLPSGVTTASVQLYRRHGQPYLVLRY